MPGKTYTVYMSSTLDDLREERQAVKEALGGRAVVKESYGASEQDLIASCMEDVASCDLYIGIIGLRYGYVPAFKNPDGKSITELEYEAAGNRPRLIFLKSPGAVAADRADAYNKENGGGELIKNFRDRLGSGKDLRPSLFSKPDELRFQVLKAFEDLTRREANAAGSGAAYVPHEVPPPMVDFTGRSEELALLRAAIERDQYNVICISGTPGVGKSELARELIGELAGAYPDGQIYLNLKGTSKTPLSSREALRYSIEKFANGSTLPDDEDELSKLWRSKLYDRRVILLMDNAAESGQVEPQAPPPKSCLLVVTSRAPLDLPDMFACPLKLLEPADAEALLRRIESRIGSAAARIAELCSYLPYALRTAAGTLKKRPDMTVPRYVQALESNVAQRHLLIDPVIQTSYDLLSPDTLKEQWCGLACFEDPFTQEAVVEVWQLTVDEAFDKLGSLLAQGMLLFSEADSRYYLHDLMRLFAQKYLKKDAPYRQRHAGYFFNYALEHRHPLKWLDAFASEVFAAYEFCELERGQRGLGSAIDMIGEILGDQMAAVNAAYLTARLFKRKRRFEEARNLYEACLVRSAGKVSMEGKCLRSIGEIYWLEDNFAAADDYAEKAVERLSSGQEYDSHKELIFTLHLRSEQFLRKGSLDKAEQAARASLEVPLEKREPDAGLSNGAVKLIAYLLQRNDLDAASKMLAEQRDNLDGIDRASILGQTGCAMSDAGRFAEADRLLRDALSSYDAIPNDVGSSWTQRCLGQLALRRGDIGEARKHYQDSLDTCVERNLGPCKTAVALIALIRFCHLAGDAGAIAGFEQRLAGLHPRIVDSDLTSRRQVARALRELERSLTELGREEEAKPVRLDREWLDPSMDTDEAATSAVEVLADRWGCDALSLAWPGQLLRELIPRPVK